MALKVFTQVREGKFPGQRHFAAPMPIKRAFRHLTPGNIQTPRLRRTDSPQSRHHRHALPRSDNYLPFTENANNTFPGMPPHCP
jgi:hypothetical protein